MGEFRGTEEIISAKQNRNVKEASSSKTCMVTISSLKSTIYDQISEMSSLSYIAMDLKTETVNFSASRKSTSIFSITRC